MAFLSLSCTFVFPIDVQAAPLGVNVIELLRATKAEVERMPPNGYLSAELTERALAPRGLDFGVAAYVLSFSDPADPRVSAALTKWAAMEIPVAEQGIATWALLYQRIRSLPQDQQLGACINELRAAWNPYERTIIIARLGFFPQSREIGEALLSALSVESDPKAQMELGFQLAAYHDMDIVERAMLLFAPLAAKPGGLDPYVPEGTRMFMSLVTWGAPPPLRRGYDTGKTMLQVMQSKLQGDVCPGTMPQHIANEEGCSISQLCPPCGTWKNHGEFVSCVAQAANDFVTFDYIPPSEHGRIVSAAAQSDVGKPHYDGVGCEDVDIDAHR